MSQFLALYVIVNISWLGMRASYVPGETGHHRKLALLSPLKVRHLDRNKWKQSVKLPRPFKRSFGNQISLV